MNLDNFQKKARFEAKSIDMDKAKQREINKGKLYEQIFFWILIAMCGVIFVFAGLAAIWNNVNLQVSLLIIAIIYGIIKAINYRQNKNK